MGKFDDLYRETISQMLGGEEFVSPYRFAKSGQDFVEQSLEGNPRRFIDRSDPNYQESIFAEPSKLPSIDSGGIAGEIRGLPKSVAKAVRKAMQNEIKARGPSPFEARSDDPFEGVSSVVKSLYKDAFDNQLTPGEAHTDVMEQLKANFSGVHKNTFTQYTDEAYKVFDRLQGAPNPLKESSVISKLLRGTWYRGQDQYPSGHTLEEVIGPSGVEKAITTKQFGKEYSGEAPTFMGLRTNLSNLGEPHGASLSYDPTISTGFNAPKTISIGDDAPKKLKELMKRDIQNQVEYEPDSIYNRAKQLSQTHKVARVMPLFGGTPEDKILFPWREEHGKIFRQAYLDTAKEMREKHPALGVKIQDLAPGTSGKVVGDTIEHFYQYDSSKYKSSKDEFNSLMSDRLRAQGWKGMLHHPDRGSYGEYEMRMFDPYDVMYVDKRAIPERGYEFDTNKMSSQSAGRLRRMKEPLKEAHQEVTQGKTRSLADWYKDITREEILGLKADKE